MHEYMMIDDLAYFLYAIIDVPLQNVIRLFTSYTIDTFGNMHERNRFKMSHQVSSSQEILKEIGIEYLVEFIQLGDKQLGVQEDIKEMNSKVKGDGQETNDTVILNLVVGSNTNTHSVDMDKLM